jgi:hypothetical protein
MGAEKQQLLICDATRPNIRVVRFVQPDMRDQLYNAGAIGDCTLFEDLRASAMQNLAPGDALVLNLGLIDWFPTAFYRFILRANEETRAAQARLMLCCLPPLAKEAFELMGGDRTFAGQVYGSESQAVYAAGHPKS